MSNYKTERHGVGKYAVYERISTADNDFIVLAEFTGPAAYKDSELFKAAKEGDLLKTNQSLADEIVQLKQEVSYLTTLLKSVKKNNDENVAFAKHLEEENSRLRRLTDNKPILAFSEDTQGTITIKIVKE